MSVISVQLSSCQCPCWLTMITFLSLASWIIVSSVTCLDFRLANCFQSGMVLQSSASSRGATVWGWGMSGADVDVEFTNGTWLGRGRVGEEGRWSLVVMLSPGGPYNLTVHHRGAAVLPQRAELLNVLAGDVWLCVGSDNMALPMSGLANSSAEISNSLNFSQVRHCQLKEAWTEEPQVRHFTPSLYSAPAHVTARHHWRIQPALERPHQVMSHQGPCGVSVHHVLQTEPPSGLRHLLDVRTGTEQEDRRPRGSCGGPRQ